MTKTTTPCCLNLLPLSTDGYEESALVYTKRLEYRRWCRKIIITDFFWFRKCVFKTRLCLIYSKRSSRLIKHSKRSSSLDLVALFQHRSSFFYDVLFRRSLRRGRHHDLVEQCSKRYQSITSDVGSHQSFQRGYQHGDFQM